eukprot:737054-Amphidinium_carterae.1
MGSIPVESTPCHVTVFPAVRCAPPFCVPVRPHVLESTNFIPQTSEKVACTAGLTAALHAVALAHNRAHIKNHYKLHPPLPDGREDVYSDEGEDDGSAKEEQT